MRTPLVLVLLAGCAGPPTLDAGLCWEPRARAVAEGRDGSLAVPASEAATLIWARGDLHYSRSHDGGDSFPPGLVVNSVPGEVKAHGESAPWLAFGPRQEILAAWEGNGDIKFARSTNFGRSFQPPVRLDDGPEKAHASFLHLGAGADGTTAVAWLDFRRQGLAALYAAVSKDAGGSWGANVQVADAVCPCCRPAVVAAPGGVVHVIWRHVYPTHVRDLAVSTSRDGGLTWSVPVRIAEDGWVLDGCPHSGPSALLDGGRLTVAWYTGAGNRSSVRVARSSDEGRTWTAAREVQGGLADANHPHLASGSAGTFLILQARDGSEDAGWGPMRPWAGRLGEDGSVRLEALPGAGGTVSYPRLALGTAGRIYAVWTEDGSRVVLCRGRVTG
jgi:hypothetical protein